MKDNQRPLLIMVTYNRPKETMRTLEALADTTPFGAGDAGDPQLVIMDNGSRGGLPMDMVRWANDVTRNKPGCVIEVVSLPRNLGCPRALNMAIKRYRKPGQPVVKIDNDVRMLTGNWPYAVRKLIVERQGQGRKVAMVGAWYNGVLEGRLLETEDHDYGGSPIHHVAPVIGHTVWHTGEFLDLVGYFDVLHKDHLYGFEDLLMSHKAAVAGWDMLVWEGWQIENIQRSPSLGKQGQSEHVKAMRPHYNARRQAITAGGTLRTEADGRPARTNQARNQTKGDLQ